jgi:hypothetical protein
MHFTRTLGFASAAPRSRYSMAFASSAFSPSPSTPSSRVCVSSSLNLRIASSSFCCWRGFS